MSSPRREQQAIIASAVQDFQHSSLDVTLTLPPRGPHPQLPSLFAMPDSNPDHLTSILSFLSTGTMTIGNDDRYPVLATTEELQLIALADSGTARLS